MRLLLADFFCGRWLTAISPCPFVPVEWASPRQPFSAGAGVPLHTQEWQFPIALQGGVLETHHDEHPMKHRSWSDVITKEMVALGNCEKTNATETLWREEWPNSCRITYNRPCVSYREPYPLPLSSAMVSYKKVSCYDTRYADQNQPMCICHSQPPFLFPARRKPTMTPTVRNSASL